MRMLITGITGQDGALMAKLLLKKGHIVFGSSRSASKKELWRLKELQILGNKNLTIVKSSLDSLSNVQNLIKKAKPDQIYNFASQNFSAQVLSQPLKTIQINAMSVAYFLEAIRRMQKRPKFFQASSMQILNPTSAYSASKLFSSNLVVMYRKQYGLFASQAILYNHESEYRGEMFVTRKITSTISKIKAGKAKELILENTSSRRDWGYAPDFVEQIYKIMQRSSSGDFALLSGKEHSVKELVGLAFKFAGLDETKYVRINKTPFKEMVKKMVNADIKRMKK